MRRLQLTAELKLSCSPLFSPRCRRFELPQPRLSVSAIPRETVELILGFNEAIFNLLEIGGVILSCSLLSSALTKEYLVALLPSVPGGSILNDLARLGLELTL